MTADLKILKYPRALVTEAIVRGLIEKQCEILRAIQLHPELAACTTLSPVEIEQTIAAHMIALSALKESP